METPEEIVILPAEFVGMAEPDADGYLHVGGVKVPWHSRAVGVYVRRASDDLRVMEIAIAHHDGLAMEELREQEREAERYTLGPKEYWRGEMVGKWMKGIDRIPMTDADFEEYWAEGQELGDENDDEA